MSFLYPRTIDVHRPNSTPGQAGAVAYQGETAANETVILQNLPANIQHQGGKGGNTTGLPADTPKKADWYIFIPRCAAALGSIAENDVVVDELGRRYQVIAAYWNSLGHRLSTELLQM